MTLIKKPDFVTYSGDTAVRWHCKNCGSVISEMRRGGMWRSRDYAEIKIRFADGSHHITSLCSKCVPVVRNSQPLLNAIYDADMEDMIKQIPDLPAVKHDRRGKIKVIHVEFSAKGIP